MDTRFHQAEIGHQSQVEGKQLQSFEQRFIYYLTRVWCILVRLYCTLCQRMHACRGGQRGYGLVWRVGRPSGLEIVGTMRTWGIMMWAFTCGLVCLFSVSDCFEAHFDSVEGLQ